MRYDVINDSKWNEFKDDDLKKECEKKKKRQLEMKPATWDFQEDLIFKRYDAFVQRLSTIQEFFRTSEQFLKLVNMITPSLKSLRYFKSYLHFTRKKLNVEV